MTKKNPRRTAAQRSAAPYSAAQYSAALCAGALALALLSGCTASPGDEPAPAEAAVVKLGPENPTIERGTVVATGEITAVDGSVSGTVTVVKAVGQFDLTISLVVPLPSLALAFIVDTPAVVFDSLAHLSIAAILSTIYTAVAASLIGYGIWNSLLATYPTSAVVPFTLLVPVIGIIAAWLAQGEEPTPTEIIGGAVMLAGVAAAVVQRDFLRRRLR